MSRAERGNPADAFIVVSGYEALAALGTAGGKDFAPICRGHARTEPMGTGALEFAGLESALHGGNRVAGLQKGL